jgi:MFS family permease
MLQTEPIEKNLQYYKFGLYGFLKNLRFYEAFLLLFFLEKDISYLQIGLLYSIREITIMLFEIPSGLVADALGRKRTLIASFALYILSFMIFYFSSHFGLMAMAMFWFAVADAFRSGVHKAMIFQYLTRRGKNHQKTDYYGHTRSWSQTGSAIASLISGILVFYYGSYRSIFALSTLPYLLDMLLVASYPGYLNGQLERKGTLGFRKKFGIVWHAIILSFKDFHLFRILASLSSHTGYYKAAKDYIQPAIVSMVIVLPWLKGIPEEKKAALAVGIIYFFLYLLTARTSRYSGKFLQHFAHYGRPLNRTLLLTVATGIATGIFYLLHSYFFSILGFILIMVIENLRKPVGVAFLSESSEDKATASILSIQSQVQSLFAAVFAFVIGWGAQLGGPGTGILFGACLLALLFPFSRIKPIA